MSVAENTVLDRWSSLVDVSWKTVHFSKFQWTSANFPSKGTRTNRQISTNQKVSLYVLHRMTKNIPPIESMRETAYITQQHSSQHSNVYLVIHHTFVCNWQMVPEKLVRATLSCKNSNSHDPRPTRMSNIYPCSHTFNRLLTYWLHSVVHYHTNSHKYLWLSCILCKVSLQHRTCVVSRIFIYLPFALLFWPQFCLPFSNLLYLAYTCLTVPLLVYSFG